MSKIVIAVFSGLVIGVTALHLAYRYSLIEQSQEVSLRRDVVAETKLGPIAAEKHRAEQFVNLRSVRDVISLPTEFLRAQALFALAGRSDSAEVQNLIFQADRIADDVERHHMLETLFFRLAEIDPESALTLSRIEQFRSIEAMEEIVWRTWARNDTEAALFAAKSQPGLRDRDKAAQSLYAAFGYLGNTTTDYIHAELGIEPNRSTRSRYIQSLAEESIDVAIAFINDVSGSAHRREYISWLANYVGVREPNSALNYAGLFESPSAKASYENAVNGVFARENPQAVLDRLIADGQTMSSSRDFYVALQALATTDIDAAKEFFAQSQSTQARQQIGAMIVAELAKHDIDGALAWADENETSPMPNLRMIAIRQLAQTDPQAALTAALNMDNLQTRRMLVANVVQQIAMKDPATATTYLEQIDNKQQREEAVQQIATSWLQQDPDSAMDWIIGQDDEVSEPLLRIAGMTLVHTDIDAAIRLLPRMDSITQNSMRQQIAQVLVSSRSIADAQAFVAQFEAQPGFDQLQASLISGLVETDIVMAKQLAEQLVKGPARDRAYLQIIEQQTLSSPTDAARLLEGFESESSRGAAAGILAARWFDNDPDAALTWVSKMPAGAIRDDAILQMASRTNRPPVSMTNLVDTIENSEKRSQARMTQAYRLMRTDPARAIALMQNEDVSEEQRRQMQETFNRVGIAVSIQ